MPTYKCYCFIDAANLFYGGEKSLGWSIDYQKLFAYLKEKFGVSKVFYYAGVELNDFEYDPLIDGEIDLNKVLRHHQRKLLDKNLSEAQIVLLGKYIQRIKFYRKLQKFGYILRLKPTKVFYDGERTIKKANCDVDLTFDLMRFLSQYREAVVLSGDGDFTVVLKYLRSKSKKVHILSRAERTAKEIRRLAGRRFMDFNYLRERLSFVRK